MTARAAVALAVVAGLAAPAAADQARAREHQQQAQQRTAAGDHAGAIAALTAAYAEFAAPQYLYNIAQIYRLRLGDCAAAREHYRRFLEHAPFQTEALRQAEQIARQHVETLGASCADPPAEVEPAPVTAEQLPPPGVPPAAAAAMPTIARAPGAAEARGFQLAPALGVAIYSLGEVDVPVTFATRLAAGFRLRALFVGATVELSPIPYRGDPDGTAWFVPVLVGFEQRTGSSRVALTWGLMIGALLVSNLDSGNPFTLDGRGVGPQIAPCVRGSVGLDVAVRLGFSLRLGADYTLAATGDDFAGDIGTISEIGITTGMAWRL